MFFRGNRRDYPEVNSNMFRSLWSDFDDVFNDSVKYTDEEGNLVCEIEAVGFNKENLTVDVEDGIVTIKGTRKIGIEGNYVGQKALLKRMKLSGSEDVEASITDGILKLIVKSPKKESTKIELK